MRGYLEVLDDMELPQLPIWTKAHRMMSEQTHRMDGLVNQLLTLTKLENKQSVLTQTQINVPKLLGTIRQEALTLSNRKHNIDLNVDPSLYLLSSEEQLRSAFSNLVYNAVRYTPEGGNIKITWQKLNNGNAYFGCQDDGDGIAHEHIARLTERFYRVDEARTRDSGGSGLGLSIVKHVLSNHDSELKIASQPQKGSTFSFEIDQRFTKTVSE